MITGKTFLSARAVSAALALIALSLSFLAAARAAPADLGRLEPFRPGEVKLRDGIVKRSFETNLRYLKSLDVDMLLFSYRFSAYLRYPGSPPGGWEAPLNPNRGTFLGHWMSGAARAIAVSGDGELRAKADAIVEGLRKCQVANGGGWVEAWGPERIYSLEGKHGGDRRIPGISSAISSSSAEPSSTTAPGGSRSSTPSSAAPSAR